MSSLLGKIPLKRESVISQLRKEEAAAAAPETETVCSLGFLMGLLGESAERNGNRQKGGEDRKGREYLPQIEEISLPPTYQLTRLQSFSEYLQYLLQIAISSFSRPLILGPNGTKARLFPVLH